jgi:DNA-binding response OmpR family regulator
MIDKSKFKILVADDDTALLTEIERYLRTLGFSVDVADDGSSALTLAETLEPDLVVLDLTFLAKKASMSKPIDGIEVLRRLREYTKIPVVMLSSTNISSVKIMALTIGADDFLPKPFAMDELGARIDAVLRRSHGEDAGDGVLTFRRLKIDPSQRRVWKDGVVTDLTPVEFDMLYLLARRTNHVLTRDKLLQLAWRNPSYSIPKAVDVHIGHIRKKIEDDPSNPTILVTVRGTGYRFEEVCA